MYTIAYTMMVIFDKESLHTLCYKWEQDGSTCSELSITLQFLEIYYIIHWLWSLTNNFV